MKPEDRPDDGVKGDGHAHDAEHGDGHDDHGHGHGIKYDHGEAAFPMACALAVTAGMTFVLFLKPDLVVGLAQQLTGIAP
ncbi:MAG: hypothetical protein RLN77_06930 [Rhodospirillales bacterium]